MESIAIRNEMPIQELGKMFFVSKLFNDTTSAEQAMVKIIAGQEMGLAPFEAMTGLNIIKGKVTAGAHVIAGKIKTSGRYQYRMKELTEERCHLEFFEKSDFTGGKWQKIGDSIFTIQDAEKAGLIKEKTGKDGENYNLYGKYARNLLFSRAISNGEAWFCPDLFSIRLYTEGELPTDAPPQGNEDIIDAEPPADIVRLRAEGDRLVANLLPTHRTRESWERKRETTDLENLRKIVAWLQGQLEKNGNGNGQPPAVQQPEPPPEKLTPEEISRYLDAVGQEYGETSPEVTAFGDFIYRREWTNARKLGEKALELLHN